MFRRHQHLRSASRRTSTRVVVSLGSPASAAFFTQYLASIYSTIDIQAIAAGLSGLFACFADSVDAAVLEDAAERLLVVTNYDFSVVLPTVALVASPEFKEKVAAKSVLFLRTRDWKRFLCDFKDLSWSENTVFDTVARTVFQTSMDLHECISAILDCGVELEVAAIAVQRYRESPYAIVCFQAFSNIRCSIATRALTLSDYEKLKGATEAQRFLLVYYSVFERENEDPESLQATLKKSLEMVEDIHHKVKLIWRKSTQCCSSFIANSMHNFASEFPSMRLAEFSLPTELRRLENFEEEKQPPQFVESPWIGNLSPINRWIQDWLLSADIPLAPEDREKRVFPVSLTSLIENLSFAETDEALTEAQKLTLVEHEIVKISFAEFLIFVEMSSLSADEKMHFYQTWVETHSDNFEGTLKSILKTARIGLLAVFTRDQDEPQVHQIPTVRHNISDFATPMSLKWSIEKFLVSREQKVYILSVSLDSKEAVSLEAAKQLIEEAIDRAIPIEKVICLLVWPTRRNDEMLKVSWPRPWKLASFENLHDEGEILRSEEAIADLLHQSTEEMIRSQQYFPMWRLLHRYYYQETSDFTTSDSTLIPKIIQCEAISQILNDRLIENLPQFAGKDDWKRAVLTGSECLNKNDLMSAVPTAIEQAAFNALRPILNILENFSAFHCFFGDIRTNILQEIWLKTLTRFDFSHEYAWKPTSAPLKVPFILLDYLTLITPYINSGDWHRFQSEFAEKSVIGSSFDCYPDLMSLYIADLVALELVSSPFQVPGTQVFLCVCGEKPTLVAKIRTFVKYRQQISFLCSEMELGDRADLQASFFRQFERLRAPSGKAGVCALMKAFQKELNVFRQRKLFYFAKNQLLCFNTITHLPATAELTLTPEVSHPTAILLASQSLLFTGGIKGYMGKTYLNSVYLVSTGGGARKAMDMLAERCYHGAAEWGNYVYVFGGLNGVSTLSSNEQYDLSTGLWDSLATMNEPRSHFNPLVTASLIYLIGGMTRSVEVFNPVSASFVRLHVALLDATPCAVFESDGGIVVLATTSVTLLRKTEGQELNLVESKAHSRFNVWSAFPPVALLGEVYLLDSQSKKAKRVIIDTGECVERKSLI